MDADRPRAAASWTLPAVPATVPALRWHAEGFALAHGLDGGAAHAVALAVSEAVTNVVLHAYAGEAAPGLVHLRCSAAGGAVEVVVADEGRGIDPAAAHARRFGHGLATIGRLTTTLDVRAALGGGTELAMAFGGPDLVVVPQDVPGAALCRLALADLADAACVDVVRDGVLRRVAAEVDGDAALTRWLRDATPPAKPGTATWGALRAAEPKVVVHDPAAARSPGGPGAVLGLRWWAVLPLIDPDGALQALWGFGGRGRRGVPDRTDLALLSAEGRALAR